MSNSAGVSKKSEDAHPTDALGTCSQFLVRVAHLLLLLCMYNFSYFMSFVVYVCFPCLVCVPGLHSFDYRYKLGSLDQSLKSFFCCCWSRDFCDENCRHKTHHVQHLSSSSGSEMLPVLPGGCFYGLEARIYIYFVVGVGLNNSKNLLVATVGVIFQ